MINKPKCNFKKESDYRYLVYNQRGFNNALYDYYDVDDKNKKEIRKMVCDFPKKYPCKIVIIDMTFECSRIWIDIDYNINFKEKLWKIIKFFIHN